MVSGVTVEQGSSSAFQTAFTTSTAAALGIDATAVVVNAVTLVTVRRHLRDSVHRALGTTSSVKISYSVSTAATTTSVTTSLTNSAPTITNSLNTVGVTEGFVAVADGPVIDLSTATPTSSPTLAPVTEPPSPAPVADVTEPPSPAPVADVTEPPSPAPVADTPTAPDEEVVVV